MDSLKESNTTTINNKSENGSEFDKNKDTYKDSKDKTKTLGESNKDTNKKSSLMKEKA